MTSAFSILNITNVNYHFVLCVNIISAAIVALGEDLWRNLDRENVSLLIILDHSTGFDAISTLVSFWIVCLTWDWAEPCCRGSALSLWIRFQKACWETTVSPVAPEICPPVSTLSHMLFNIDMKRLDEVIRGLRQRCYQHVDDTHLYLTLSLEPRETVDKLGPGLEMVMDWMRVNKLKRKPKMEILLVGSDSSWDVVMQWCWMGLFSLRKLMFIVWWYSFATPGCPSGGCGLECHFSA